MGDDPELSLQNSRPGTPPSQNSPIDPALPKQTLSHHPPAEEPHSPDENLPSPASDSLDEPLCRICLAGRDDGDPSLGKFIQPCLCRGTMAHIHVGCLQRWRKSSPSVRSFYSCDQCGYRYKLRRAKVAGMAENTAILGGVTFVLFFILVILAGFVAGWFLETYSSKTVIVDDSWADYGLGPFSYDSTGKMIGDVVGQAVQVLHHKLHLDQVTNPVEKVTPKLQTVEDSFETILEPIPDAGAAESNTYRYVKPKQARNSKQKVKSAQSHERPFGSAQNLRQGVYSFVTNKLNQLIQHTVKGLAFIGVLSFFQLAISISLFSPWNFGFRNSILRFIQRTNRNNSFSNGSNGIMVLFFVLLGLFKALQTVWRLVRRSSQWMLRKIEDGVLDVRASS